MVSYWICFRCGGSRLNLPRKATSQHCDARFCMRDASVCHCLFEVEDLLIHKYCDASSSINICFRCTSRWASSSIFFASSSIKFSASSSTFAAFSFADLDRRLAWTWKVSIHEGIFKLIDRPFCSVLSFNFLFALELGDSNSFFAWTWKLLNYKRIVMESVNSQRDF